jgi:3',5'-cyclic AMP phosphodiesterase CpdA
MALRIAHLSDIHFGDENKPALAGATAWLQAQDLDLIVVSGDLTRFAEVNEFEAAAAWLEALTAPTLVTPGNHDAPYLDWLERITAPFRRYERHIGPAPAQGWRGSGLAARGVNTARGAQPRLNWSKGQIAASQAREAVDWFKPEDAVRIVVAHHPLIEVLGGPMTARVWGGERAARRFAEGEVDLVLSGHVHTPFARPYPFGDNRTYAVGAGTLSVRERGAPAGFNVLEVEDGAFRVTALGWTGSHMEPWRTWALDRRRRCRPTQARTD